MRVRLGAAVLDRDMNEIGKVSRLVIDPQSRQIMQLVARHGHIDTTDYIVERGMTSHVDPDGRVYLKLSGKEVENLRQFYAVNYNAPGRPPEFSWVRAVGAPLGGPLTDVTDTSVQYNTLRENLVVVTKGMDVQDKEFEKFGELEDVEFDESITITGFTVKSGGPLRHKLHSFRIDQVAGVGQEYVRVNVSHDEALATPASASHA
jgi:uncharacterized protein YrrD